MSTPDNSGLEQITPRSPMRVVHVERPFNRLIGTVPKSALAVPSMMSVAERRFLFGLASTYYAGEGVIVDAGIFLGSSTVCFGEGLRLNANFEKALNRWQLPIISFERGVVTPTMPAFFHRNALNVDLKPGASFMELVCSNLEPVSGLVDLRIGDIQETGNVDRPIELLFLDVLKLPEINKFVVENYFSKLIPGRSIVIQQDYFYDLLPYVKTYQEFFAEYFTYVGEIGSTGVFLCKAKIPQEATVDILERISSEEQIRLAGIALQRSTDPARRFLMALSKTRLIRRLLGAKAGQSYLQFVKNEYPGVDVQGLPRLREALRSAEIACRERGKAKGDLPDEEHFERTRPAGAAF